LIIETFERGATPRYRPTVPIPIVSIVRSLDVRIIYGTEQSSGGTRRLDALTAYLQGRHEYLRFTGAGNARARELFVRSLELDPNYADAIVALAHTYFIEMAQAPKEDWDGILARIAELELLHRLQRRWYGATSGDRDRSHADLDDDQCHRQRRGAELDEDR
jgi:hypothetical protein